MNNNKKNNDEFKPNIIEPIEGQMCYDELLVPQNEEEKKVVETAVEGQLDIWSMATKNEISSVKNVSKMQNQEKVLKAR